ncbi:MAG: DinB family protein [Flavobacteriaceae bacterium]|nr:MAG: DinB family protein [Flavobacteriaceae bacterium]
MRFTIHSTLEVLRQTPQTLGSLLKNLPEQWVFSNEGENTWSPYDIVGHLLHGEKTDWIPRLKKILYDNNKLFNPFNRFAQFKHSREIPVSDLLSEFKNIRQKNLEYVQKLQLSEKDLLLTGIHPEFGKVTAKELLATWATHDLSHIAQISRVLAKQYKNEVGPWAAYISILNT